MWRISVVARQVEQLSGKILPVLIDAISPYKLSSICCGLPKLTFLLDRGDTLTRAEQVGLGMCCRKGELALIRYNTERVLRHWEWNW
jgi:hypothetical protein